MAIKFWTGQSVISVLQIGARRFFVAAFVWR